MRMCITLNVNLHSSQSFDMYIKIAGCGQLQYHTQQETELQVAVSGGKRV